MPAASLDRPIPAALAVVVRRGQVLLVRRANPPDRGKWGFPGGRIEAGESIGAAALRELREETGLLAEAGPAFAALDVIERDAAGDLAHHFVLIAVPCRWLAGEAAPADDALEARWFTPAEIAALGTDASTHVAEVATGAVDLVAYTGAPAGEMEK
jgi:8-oxo-dGTP diphosphatase